MQGSPAIRKGRECQCLTNAPSLTSVSDLLSLQLISNATSYTSESTSIRHADYARNRRKLVSAVANGARRICDHVYINIKGFPSTIPYFTTINHFLQSPAYLLLVRYHFHIHHEVRHRRRPFRWHRRRRTCRRTCRCR
jgi:hypothetical protein